METIGERIKYVRKEYLKKNQKDFGEQIGLRANSISCIETGENTPTEQTIKAICREFKIRYLWLTQGIEPMEQENDCSTMARIDAIMTGESEAAKKIFKAFSELDETQWETLANIIKKVANEFMDN